MLELTPKEMESFSNGSKEGYNKNKKIKVATERKENKNNEK